MDIESRENILTMSHEYRIRLFGLTFYRTLTQEQVIFRKFPLWYRFSKWLQPILCLHEWIYDKTSWTNFASMFYKEYKCRKCKLEKQFWYRLNYGNLYEVEKAKHKNSEAFFPSQVPHFLNYVEQQVKSSSK